MIGRVTLGRIAAMVNKTLTDSCTIQRNTQVVDDGGNHVMLWSPVATVKCRLISDTQRQKPEPVAGRETPRTPYRLILPAGTDVLGTDRAVVDNVIYEIQDVKASLTDGVFVEVEVLRYVADD